MPDITTKKQLIRFLSDNYFNQETVPLNYGETRIVIEQMLQFLEDVAYNDWELAVKDVFMIKRTNHEGKMKPIPTRGKVGETKDVYVEPYASMRYTFPAPIGRAATQGLRDREKEKQNN